MITINYTDIHVTNVCNLSCNHCGKLSNYAFKGHQNWSDYKEDYTKWASIVQFKTIGIVGGEPFGHPELVEWIDGITTLWPDANIKILTNGTQFKHWPELYDRIRTRKIKLYMSAHAPADGPFNSATIPSIEEGLRNFFCPPLRETRIYDVTTSDELLRLAIIKYKQIKKYDWPECHSPADFALLDDSIREECKTLFNFTFDVEAENNIELWLAKYNEIKADSWPECHSPADFALLDTHIQNECKTEFDFDSTVYSSPNFFELTDVNGVTINVEKRQLFNKTMVELTPRLTLAAHSSDARIAHGNCTMTFPAKQDHSLSKGKLWKCGTLGVVKADARDQFTIELTDAQKKLIDDYTPADPNWDIDKIKSFVDNLHKVIPQCSLCPENKKINTNPIHADKKKIKIYRSNN